MNEFIDLLRKIKKREDEDLIRFVDFLFFNGVKKITVLDKPDETRKDRPREGNFDYLIQLDNDEKMALEFTQIFEKEEKRVRSLQWGNLVGAFNEELKRYSLRHGQFNWSGIWNVETPENFGATRNKSRIIARKNVSRLTSAIEKKESSIEIDGFVLKLKKVIEQQRGSLFFSTGSKAGFVDPASDISPKLEEKLPEKNEQLTTEKAKRVLVIVNKYVFGETSEIISALSRIDGIWKYENFDEIYFEESPSRFILIFSSELRNAWTSRKFLVNNSFIGPFQLWIFSLRNNNPKKTFLIVRKILTEQLKSADKLFPDNFAREEIVQIGNWLIEQERFEDATWLIDKFIDDPDPEEPEHYKGTPSFNYHEQIAQGEDPSIITTVRGHLAWVIQKLTFNQNHITRALSYTKQLLSRKNLYSKSQAIVPLIEIAKRRQWLDGYGKRPYQGTYEEFHKLVFDLLRLVKDHQNYRAIAKLLSYIFWYYKDLSTEEALQVLDSLEISDQSAESFVYFGIFRKRHYKDQPIEFDGEKLDEKLKEMIRNKNESHQRLLARITWNLWRILDKNRNEFDTIKPYIDLMITQPYQRRVYVYIEFIIRDWMKDRPEVCIQWYKSMLFQISEFVDQKNQLQALGGLWLMSAEKIVQVIANHNPDELLEVMEKLVSLWKKGVVIGSPKRLFETFRLVSDRNQATKIKRRFQKWYNLMKRLNPKLEKVNWN
ncbi:MAG: hypothetical protein ACFFCW_47675 [Candidatus Hodarchaeota archaeon]